MVLVRGDAVLDGELTAPCTFAFPAPGSVYVCPELTVTAARLAINAGAVGIITATGDFACHAANLLRNARERGNRIAWIRGLVVKSAQRVSIGYDGACDFNASAIVHSVASIRVTPSTFRRSAGNRSWDAVCLWPERVYADGEFALARLGLERGASELAGAPVKVTRWRNRIWFDSPALTNAELLEFALDQSRSVPYLERMVIEYSTLIARFVNNDFSEDIPLAYFSTLLPFHKSYGFVIRHILDANLNVYRRAEDAALTNGVVQWLAERPEFTASTKVPGDPEWDGLFPPTSIRTYVDDAALKVSAVAPAVPADVAYWLALVAVVKEFKMIISKNIYARFLAPHP